MNSKANLVYVTAALAALALGLGVSFWRAAADNDELTRDNQTLTMALEAAQDEAKAFREKLDREIKAREYAEAAQTVAEHSERATREKLGQETRARRAAEQSEQAMAYKVAEEIKARAAAEAIEMDTAAELQELNTKFAAVEKARQAAEEARGSAEKALETANTQIEQERNALQSVEFARQEAERAAARVTAQLNEEISARKLAESALAAAQEQVRVLNDKNAATQPAKKSEAASKKARGAAKAVPAENQGPAGSPDARKITHAGSGNRITEVRQPWQPLLSAQ
jgi:hypothetical protein